MTRYTIYLGISILLWACSNDIVTNEQRDRYEKCRKTLVDSKKYTQQLPTDFQVNDSVRQFYNDICDLSLDELVTKYKLTKDQIDPTITSICNSSDIIDAFKNLNIKISEPVEVDTADINNMIDSLNKLEIKLQKFKSSDYINNGDTTIRIKVAAYDTIQSPKRNKKKKNP